MASKIWRKITFSDIALIVLCIIGIFASFALTRQDKHKLQVFIYKQNRLWGVYPLARDQVIKIDEHNSVEIRDAKVRMSYADCPDKRCMKMAYVKNMPIICLPNQLLVEIKTEERERKFILH